MCISCVRNMFLLWRFTHRVPHNRQKPAEEDTRAGFATQKPLRAASLYWRWESRATPRTCEARTTAGSFAHVKCPGYATQGKAITRASLAILYLRCELRGAPSHKTKCTWGPTQGKTRAQPRRGYCSLLRSQSHAPPHLARPSFTLWTTRAHLRAVQSRSALPRTKKPHRATANGVVYFFFDVVFSRQWPHL